MAGGVPNFDTIVPLCSIPRNQITDWISCCDFSPDGRHLLVASYARVWRWAFADRKLTAELAGHNVGYADDDPRSPRISRICCDTRGHVVLAVEGERPALVVFRGETMIESVDVSRLITVLGLFGDLVYCASRDGSFVQYDIMKGKARRSALDTAHWPHTGFVNWKTGDLVSINPHVVAVYDSEIRLRRTLAIADYITNKVQLTHGHRYFATEYQNRHSSVFVSAYSLDDFIGRQADSSFRE